MGKRATWPPGVSGTSTADPAGLYLPAWLDASQDHLVKALGTVPLATSARCCLLLSSTSPSSSLWFYENELTFVLLFNFTTLYLRFGTVPGTYKAFGKYYWIKEWVNGFLYNMCPRSSKKEKANSTQPGFTVLNKEVKQWLSSLWQTYYVSLCPFSARICEDGPTSFLLWIFFPINVPSYNPNQHNLSTWEIAVIMIHLVVFPPSL